jgi:hypothetical protein
MTGLCRHVMMSGGAAKREAADGNSDGKRCSTTAPFNCGLLFAAKGAK